MEGTGIRRKHQLYLRMTWICIMASENRFPLTCKKLMRGGVAILCRRLQWRAWFPYRPIVL